MSMLKMFTRKKNNVDAKDEIVVDSRRRGFFSSQKEIDRLADEADVDPGRLACPPHCAGTQKM